MVGAALALVIGDAEKIGAVGGEFKAEAGVGLVSEEAGTLVVDEIVVGGDGLALGVGEAEDGVERGVEAAGDDFGDDGFAGFGGRKMSSSPGRSMRPLTMVGSVSGWLGPGGCWARCRRWRVGDRRRSGRSSRVGLGCGRRG